MIFHPSAVDARMLRACAPPLFRENPVLQAIHDHLAAGGSRLRAHFCLDAAVKLGVEAADALTLATICELLHNASLFHDDLLDRAPKRRGRPSTWAAYGDTVAVCAGDLMLAGAFGIIAELSRPEMMGPVLAAVQRSTQKVILGEGAEDAAAPRTLLEYEELASGKSASLLSLPLGLALLYSGNSSSLATAEHATCAFAIGYQMVDDLTDYREDLQNGSLNAVLVALRMGSDSVSAARAVICDRAVELLDTSAEHAAAMPADCAAAMIAYAGTMRGTLARRPTHLVEQLRYEG